MRENRKLTRWASDNYPTTVIEKSAWILLCQLARLTVVTMLPKKEKKVNKADKLSCAVSETWDANKTGKMSSGWTYNEETQKCVVAKA